MTLPVLIQRNNNKVTETRLKKFYSTINQAVLMAEAEYGDKKYWFEDLSGAEIDGDGNPVPGSSPAEKWFNKYIGKHMNISQSKLIDGGRFIVYFADGSALAQKNAGTTRDWVFFPSKADKCIERYGLWNTLYSSGLGVCAFAFNFLPNSPEAYINDWRYLKDKGFEPWKYRWDGTRESLLNACKNPSGNVDSATSPAFCTALIQYDNWTISDDYPKKVSY